MTGANVFDMTTVNAGQALNTNATTSRNRLDDPTMAGLFATMLGAGISASTGTESAQNVPETGTESVPAATEAYDRFQYRETDISQAEPTGMVEKLAGAEEKLDSFGEQVVAEAAGELDVTEDEVLAALEVLGLTAIDLIEPQNLVELALELTGGEEASELLVNSGFMDLLENVETFTGQLLEELDVTAEQVDDLIMYVDNEILPPIPQDPEVEDIPEAEADPEDLIGEDIELMEFSETDAVDTEWTEDESEAVQTLTVESETVVQQQGQEMKPVESEGAEETETPVEPVQTQTQSTAASVAGEAETETEAEDQQEESLPRKGDSHRAAIQEPMTGAQPMEVQEFKAAVAETQMQDDTYLSIDTLDIIRQVAEKVRVSISENLTSMELQLNPEHLGKVYMQVTVKEGTVSAQIAAANEAVRNALEMQMAELRENLNQAGVKVDAIEVTVASHEFEQNLEQNFDREKQEGERAENVASHRRSLRLDSLDELAGLMTEEEALAAQIMRENGNTMDLTV